MGERAPECNLVACSQLRICLPSLGLSDAVMRTGIRKFQEIANQSPSKAMPVKPESVDFMDASYRDVFVFLRVKS
jgi:hypothetical protein